MAALGVGGPVPDEDPWLSQGPGERREPRPEDGVGTDEGRVWPQPSFPESGHAGPLPTSHCAWDTSQCGHRVPALPHPEEPGRIG